MSSIPSKALLGETLGALFVGATIAAVLFGITNLQVVIYYKKYPNDLWVYRYSVALIWLLDALHVAFTTHAMYFYLIDMFGDLAGALVHSVWSFKVQLGMNAFIVVYVQGLYAIRLWKLGRHFHKFLPWLVYVAVAASLGITVILSFQIVRLVLLRIPSGAAIFVIYGTVETRDFSHISTIKTAIYTVFSTIAIADLVIAFMMCYYLHKSRAATHFSTTACLLLNLMRLIIVSGLATSACSVLTLISFIVWPDTLIFLGIDFILPKLYVNSLLAMFNYRREHLESTKSSADRGGNSFPAVLRIGPHSSEGSTADTNIHIPLTEVKHFSSLDDKLGYSKGPSIARSESNLV